MNDPGNDAPQAWYCEPYAWLVFGLPAAAVVACTLTLVIAAVTFDGLVVDDYYQRGLEINKVLAREENARLLGLSADIDLAPDGGFDLTLTAQAELEFPGELEILFSHATRSALDRTVTAVHQGGGHYRGKAGVLAPGPWYVDVSTPAWRMIRRVFVDGHDTRGGPGGGTAPQGP